MRVVFAEIKTSYDGKGANFIDRQTSQVPICVSNCDWYTNATSVDNRLLIGYIFDLRHEYSPLLKMNHWYFTPILQAIQYHVWHRLLTPNRSSNIYELNNYYDNLHNFGL